MSAFGWILIFQIHGITFQSDYMSEESCLRLQPFVERAVAVTCKKTLLYPCHLEIEGKSCEGEIKRPTFEDLP